MKSEDGCLHNRMILCSTDVSGVESMSCCKILHSSLFKECHVWGRRVNKWHYCGQLSSETKLKELSKLGHDSSVGTATGSGLDVPGIESRWGARFSSPFQTRPGAHPASCAVSTGSFLGEGRWSGRGANPTPCMLRRGWRKCRGTYRLLCVLMWELKTSWRRRPWPTVGLSRQKKKKKNALW